MLQRIVFLDPSGNLTVCPNEIVTFTCKTWGGALVWVTSGDNTEQVFNDATQASSDLGIFRLSVNGVQINDMMVVDVNSTARTIVGFTACQMAMHKSGPSCSLFMYK